MRLEEIRDLANRIERERLTMALNLSKAGTSAEEVLDKLSESMAEIGRNAYGFEVSTKFYKEAQEKMLVNIQQRM